MSGGVEVVVVETLEHVAADTGDADIVLDHQRGEVLAVDQDDLQCDAAGEVACFAGEGRSRDEHALGRALVQPTQNTLAGSVGRTISSVQSLPAYVRTRSPPVTLLPDQLMPLEVAALWVCQLPPDEIVAPPASA